MSEASKLTVVVVATVLGLFALVMSKPDPQGGSVPEPVDQATAAAQRPAPAGIAQQDPRSTIFFLFDASASYHSANSAQSRMRRGIPALRTAVKKLEEQVFLPQPIRYIVGTIGTAGMSQDPLCDFQAGGGNAFTGMDTVRSGAAIRDCESRLASLTPEPRTDLQGAIKYASLVLHGPSRQPRALVLVSDLADDRPADYRNVSADLSNVCVAAIIEAGLERGDVADPMALEERASRWGEIFIAWDAVAFQYWHRVGFQAAELGRFLQRCASGK